MLFNARQSELAPALTEDEARDMMKAIHDRIKTNAPNLVRFAEQVKQACLSQGQDIDDFQLMKACVLPHFESALVEFQEEVLAEYDADYDELEEAVSVYVEKGDKELLEISKSMRIMYKSFGGDIEDDTVSPPAKELSHDEFIELMHLLASAIMEMTSKFVKSYVAENGKPTSDRDKSVFQAELCKVTESTEKAILAQRGMTMTDLHQMVQVYQSSQPLQQIFMAMQV
jgi:hypothetical protein